MEMTMSNMQKPYSEYVVAGDDAEKYARESFTFRRMKMWQVWTMTVIVAAGVVIAGIWAMV